jgi:hypothetical protein
LRDLQEPTSWVLIDAAPTHSSPIPGESFVDRHSASVPRVPRVTDFSQFNIMGVDSYHEERNHQGKENLILFPLKREGARDRKAAVRCRERLGGQLKK